MRNNGLMNAYAPSTHGGRLSEKKVGGCRQYAASAAASPRSSMLQPVASYYFPPMADDLFLVLSQFEEHERGPHKFALVL